MRRTVLAVLILGLVQCAVYCWALRSGEYRGIGCCDQWCYEQGARRIAEGHPFSYSEGLPPSTGQTSVLYPFVLSVPMALGATGEKIHDVSLALACVFYLLFLTGWAAVVARFFPPGFGRAAAVAALGLSGSLAYVAFTQCDQGLWMALSAMIAAAFAYRRERLMLFLLALAPWVRPEGMMLVTVFAAMRFFRGERRRMSLLPLLSVAGVFALNFALTGRAQFSSVAGKGYFNLYPFAVAVVQTAKDGLAIFATYLCSFPFPVSRLFSMPSPVVALGFWIGLFMLVRRWREWSTAAYVFSIAAVAAVGSVSSGGFSGLDFDRYLAWLLPLPFLVAAHGVGIVSDRIRSGFWRKLPIVALVVTTLFSTVSMAAMMKETSVSRAAASAELREEASRLPPDALVGCIEFAWAYNLPPSVRYRDAIGIFTPDFAGRTGFMRACGYEVLKHDPALRFDYWVGGPYQDGVDPQWKADEVRTLCGEPLVPGSGRHFLFRADWSAYDRAAESPLSPLSPSARLDVGYLQDERAARLRGMSREVGEYVRVTAAACRANDGLTMADGCALVSKGQVFTLPTCPGLSAKLVVRTLGRLYVFTGDGHAVFDYGSAVKLTVSVGGGRLGEFEVPVDPEVFTDYVIDVPAGLLVSSETEFRIEGEFPSFGYWLYQPCSESGNQDRSES